MALRKCDQCDEMVDEAKAFCPGCGSALVEERSRQQESNFDAMGSTVQMGQTMYNQMLSDMGLNISKAPSRAAINVEELKPALAEVTKPEPVSKGISPVIKWLIVILAVMALLVFGVVIAALLIIGYTYRFQ